MEDREEDEGGAKSRWCTGEGGGGGEGSARVGGGHGEAKGEQLYIAMGAEDQGLPAAFLDRCQHLVMIPCLSASVNVASAFSSVLAVMCLADAVGGGGPL